MMIGFGWNSLAKDKGNIEYSNYVQPSLTLSILPVRCKMTGKPASMSYFTCLLLVQLIVQRPSGCQLYYIYILTGLALR